jgi:hypothetical protein
MNTHMLRSFVCALGIGLVPAMSFAVERHMALGADGEIYRLASGSYGELFGRPTDPQAKNAVLALEIVRPGVEGVERHLVPQTAGVDLERSPSLIYEESSHTVFLVWESRNSYHSVMKLSGFDGTRWFEPPLPQLPGSILSPKTPPRVAVTRDSYLDVVDGMPVLRHRTTVHLVWGEEQGSTLDTVYVPIIFEDGVFSGSTAIVLNDLDTATELAASVEVPANLLSTPTVTAGQDARTVVVAFTSPASRRLITLEIDVLPRELVSLAGGARSQIIDTGAKLSFPANLKVLAEQARNVLLQRASAFAPEVAQSLADRTYAYILANGKGQSLSNLAEGARSQIIDTGAKLSGRGLRTIAALTRLAEVPSASTRGAASVAGEPLSHLIQLRVITSRPAPPVGNGPVAVFLGKSGEDLILSWSDEAAVYYRTSAGNGWDEQRTLALSPAFSREQANAILEQRIADR